MERQVDLKEVSDGKLYGLDDLVRADCAGCAGCSACCRGMGRSVVLDPLDVHRLTTGLSVDFESLIKDRLELNVVDGIILPNLKMTGEGEACSFLDENGRCSIHPVRPGICRIFPLGRVYENRSFRYFLQIHECKKQSRAKIRIKKWIDVENADVYEKFVSDWHWFLKDMAKNIKESGEEQMERAVCMYILKKFYFLPFDKNADFYVQFYERLRKTSDLFGTACS